MSARRLTPNQKMFMARLRSGPILLSGIPQPEMGTHRRSVVDSRTAMALVKRGLAVYTRRETGDDPFALFLEITPEGKDTR